MQEDTPPVSTKSDPVTTETLRQVLFNLSRRIRHKIHTHAQATGFDKPSKDQVYTLFQELQQVCRHIDASYELDSSKPQILVTNS